MEAATAVAGASAGNTAFKKSKRPRCDMCGKKDGFHGLALKVCVDCGVAAHGPCHGDPDSTERKRGRKKEGTKDWRCHPCAFLRKQRRKRPWLTGPGMPPAPPRPSSCVLCDVSTGAHCLHPLYTQHGPEGEQVKLPDGQLAWVHTLCASVISSSRRIGGCVYGVDAGGRYIGQTEDEGDGSDLEARQRPVHRYVVFGRDADGKQNQWSRLVEGARRNLVCFVCNKSDRGTGDLGRIAVRCTANLKGEYGPHSKKHPDRAQCHTAMHVGCARWGAGGGHGRHVYFWASPHEGDGGVVVECYCQRHADCVEGCYSKKHTDGVKVEKKRSSGGDKVDGMRVVEEATAGGDGEVRKVVGGEVSAGPRKKQKKKVLLIDDDDGVEGDDEGDENISDGNASEQEQKQKPYKKHPTNTRKKKRKIAADGEDDGNAIGQERTKKKQKQNKKHTKDACEKKKIVADGNGDEYIIENGDVGFDDDSNDGAASTQSVGTARKTGTNSHLSILAARNKIKNLRNPAPEAMNKIVRSGNDDGEGLCVVIGTKKKSGCSLCGRPGEFPSYSPKVCIACVARMKKKPKCDLCRKPQEFQDCSLQVCITCGVAVHGVCIRDTSPVGKNWNCAACAYVKAHRLHHRPTACVLCSVRDGVHSMHPLYEHGVHATLHGESAWVHSFCAMMIERGRQTGGCVYGVDAGGRYFGQTDDEGDGDGGRQRERPLHHFAISGRDEDGRHNEWSRVVEEARRISICFVCGRGDKQGTGYLRRIAVQCTANEEGEYGPYHSRHAPEREECTVAMHVGCARWGVNEATRPEKKHVYFWPSPDGDAVFEIYCTRHADNVEAHAPGRAKREKKRMEKRAWDIRRPKLDKKINSFNAQRVADLIQQKTAEYRKKNAYLSSEECQQYVFIEEMKHLSLDDGVDKDTKYVRNGIIQRLMNLLKKHNSFVTSYDQNEQPVDTKHHDPECLKSLEGNDERHDSTLARNVAVDVECFSDRTSSAHFGKEVPSATIPSPKEKPRDKPKNPKNDAAETAFDNIAGCSSGEKSSVQCNYKETGATLPYPRKTARERPKNHDFLTASNLSEQPADMPPQNGPTKMAPDAGPKCFSSEASSAQCDDKELSAALPDPKEIPETRGAHNIHVPEKIIKYSISTILIEERAAPTRATKILLSENHMEERAVHTTQAPPQCKTEQKNPTSPSRNRDSNRISLSAKKSLREILPEIVASSTTFDVEKEDTENKTEEKCLISSTTKKGGCSKKLSKAVEASAKILPGEILPETIGSSAISDKNIKNADEVEPRIKIKDEGLTTSSLRGVQHDSTFRTSISEYVKQGRNKTSPKVTEPEFKSSPGEILPDTVTSDVHALPIDTDPNDLKSPLKVKRRRSHAVIGVKLGARIAKFFEDDLYFGNITKIIERTERSPQYWHASYDDGDEEELNRHEVKRALALCKERQLEDPKVENCTI